uniref:Viral late gene transcription factor 3 zinc ribbon domain-containing protein n=1 Tax=viral metagenome TaxID=1070528 RepID=A0A6C0HLC3_9ZZZZ
MNTFKSKLKLRPNIEERQTLDATHNNMIITFEEVRNSITHLTDELKIINDQLDQLNLANSSQILDMPKQRAIWALDDKKKLIEHEIAKIQNNDDENAYMLNTGKLLSSYYKILDSEKQIASGLFANSNDNITDNTNETENTNCNSNSNINSSNNNNFDNLTKKASSSINIEIKTPTKKRTITDWFSLNVDSPIIKNGITSKKTVLIIKKNRSNSQDQQNVKHNQHDQHDQHDQYDQHDQHNQHNQHDQQHNQHQDQQNHTQENLHLTHKVVVDTKDTIYEKYMKSIDKTYINTTNDNTNIFDSCSKCLVEMLLNNNTGLLICPKCGLLETIIVDSDKPSFKEPPKEMTSFCYKRINHLNEFLAQFQAKETTNIPEDVYNEILMEIQKERINNMAKITPKKMRLILKKIHKNDYYEHVPYIINQLNGLPAPVIAQEIEEIIRGMFKAIQIPFEIYCPNKRKNFLSYNYVMYKFFELLELDEYLNCFQLLKSRTKLHQQDQIWKNICLDLNWQFIKSL